MMIEENSYTCLHRSVIETFLSMERGGIKSLPLYMEFVGRWEAENGNLDKLPQIPKNVLVPMPALNELTAITERSETTIRRYMKFLADYGLVTPAQNGALSVAVYMGDAE